MRYQYRAHKPAAYASFPASERWPSEPLGGGSPPPVLSARRASTCAHVNAGSSNGAQVRLGDDQGRARQRLCRVVDLDPQLTLPGLVWAGRRTDGWRATWSPEGSFRHLGRREAMAHEDFNRGPRHRQIVCRMIRLDSPEDERADLPHLRALWSRSSRRYKPCITAATRAPHLEHQSREVIALTATGLLGMAAPGQIQLTVVSLADRGRSHGIRHFKLDAWRSRRPTPPGEAPATGLAAVTLNRTRHQCPVRAKVAKSA